MRAGSREYFFWLHPEWWCKALCGFAWVVMLIHGWQHAGHEVHDRMTFSQELGYWMLMCAAMMLPLVMYQVWLTAAGSLWTRRHRAIAGFLAAFFVPWLVLGIAAVGLRQSSWKYGYAIPAIAFLSAALWQLTAAHRRGLIACHRTMPLAPSGWRADRDCLRFGGFIGGACVWVCWPLMLACTFAGHNLIALAGSMFVAGTERWRFRPRQVLLATLAMAGYYSVLYFAAISSRALP